MASVLVLSGYGLNCEDETLRAFELSGFTGSILHLNDLLSNPGKLRSYQVLAIPGGFSFADNTGAGNAFACKTAPLLEKVENFLEEDKLVIGICNGAQILVRLIKDLEVTFEANTSNQYQCEWQDVEVPESGSIWMRGIHRIRLPIAHGEGKLVPLDMGNLKVDVAMRYTQDVNGSYDRIAAVTAYEGKMLITMPHPERAVSLVQTDDYYMVREKCRRENVPIPRDGPGMQIFKNAYDYFR
ncbi:phosphoribosylformylglycinamidine synthase subunit PurQ [Neorickettsia findlayensis]|uniref:Phosphoribosylformylglycinamidine synthase n=1 Tax=Neorickettsia findlayensis TaxID=2686014 RepID=A0A6P1GBA9_9RICK|nr:phosphoribosylformylglycinamidine synthase subunit PurQ [Neorickettsia findlayensis]QHD65181.1 phosphoribosylformylglycinamidine synthase [Neorickettsia findlayensis]